MVLLDSLYDGPEDFKNHINELATQVEQPNGVGELPITETQASLGSISWGELEQMDTTSGPRVDSSPTGADMAKGPISKRFLESVRAHSIFAVGVLASGAAIALTTITRENSRTR